jgi:xylan 1,4-beta-xylosidase
MVENPFLRGFHPDPSICRAGTDYYVATSTFEWYPGVQVYHSRDLENWRFAGRPLDRPELLNLVGVPDSGGVWAPCLSWHDGLFYLCYTVVRRLDRHFKDTHNFLTTAESIDGPWSPPTHVNSSGFDPSLFHAEDGRKWWLSMVWDHRPDRSFFRGITLQEYSIEQRKLIGEARIIFEGTEFDSTEGPHLYRWDGYYYLMTAEGGTGYEHVVTMARAKNIEGPYETDPAGPVLTARDTPGHPLQRNGHGDLVHTPDGRIFMVHLTGRPLPGIRRSPLGREAAIQELRKTEDGWIRLKGGGSLPRNAVAIAGEGSAGNHKVAPTGRDAFDGGVLPHHYQWLRSPWPEALFSLSERPGYLRLYGRESIGSHHYQSLVARRQQHFHCEAETGLEFEPEHFQQMAGLVAYYNASKFHYLYVSRDGEKGRHLAVMSCEGDFPPDARFPDYERRVPLPEKGIIFLRGRVEESRLTFFWSPDGRNWDRVGPELDASLLSDEAGRGEDAQFTGTFIGMCCQDLSGTRRPADFRYFGYRPLDTSPTAC